MFIDCSGRNDPNALSLTYCLNHYEKWWEQVKGKAKIVVYFVFRSLTPFIVSYDCSDWQSTIWFLFWFSHLRCNFLSYHFIISCFNPKFIDYHMRTRWFWEKIVHVFPKKIADRYFAGNRTFWIESVETFNLKAWKCHKLLFWIQFE